MEQKESKDGCDAGASMLYQEEEGEKMNQGMVFKDPDGQQRANTKTIFIVQEESV